MDSDNIDPELQLAISLSLGNGTSEGNQPSEEEKVVVMMQIISSLAPNGTITGGRFKRLLRTLIQVRDDSMPSTQHVDRVFEALVPHMLPPQLGRSDLLDAQYFTHAVLQGHGSEGPIFERQDVMAAGGAQLGNILFERAHAIIAAMQSQEDTVAEALSAARSTTGEALNFNQFKRFVAALVYQRDGSLPLGERLDKLVRCVAAKALPLGSDSSCEVSLSALTDAILRGHQDTPLLFQHPDVIEAGGRDLDETLLSNVHRVIDRLNAGTATWRESQLQTILTLPQSWIPFSDASQTMHRAPLMLNGSAQSDAIDECNRVAERFRRTCPQHRLLNIWRIQNAHKWRQNRMLWLEMECRADGIGANEHLLFHGTAAETANRVVSNGFNRSFSNVAAFGTGVYFAREARYSANIRYAVPDTNRAGMQSMFLARVLVGQSERGFAGLRYPNEVQGTLQRFDSFVDRLASPHVVVSCHHDSQAYPEYLIEFTSPVGWNFDLRVMPANSPLERARQILQRWVRQGYKDSFGTQGRLDLSNLDLENQNLIALVPDFSLHLPQLRILNVGRNPRLTQLPPQFLSNNVVSITVGTTVQLPDSYTNQVYRV